MALGMIIDGHAHACGEYLTAEGVIAGLDRNGADMVVLVPGEHGSARDYGVPDLAAAFPRRDVVGAVNVLIRAVIGLGGKAREIERGNALVRSLVERHPDRIVQFYWARLSSDDFEDRLDAAFRTWAFQGVKLHQCWDRFGVGSERFRRLTRWATERGLPVFVHLYSKADVRKLVAHILQHPETTFIIGHLFGLEEYMKADLGGCSVWFDMSTPQLVSAARLAKAVAHFGARRIILGSDVPYGRNNLALALQRVRLGDSEAGAVPVRRARHTRRACSEYPRASRGVERGASGHDCGRR